MKKLKTNRRDNDKQNKDVKKYGDEKKEKPGRKEAHTKEPGF